MVQENSKVNNPNLEGYNVVRRYWDWFYNPAPDRQTFIAPRPKCSGVIGDDGRFNVWSVAVAAQGIVDGARVYPQELGPLIDPTVKALYQFKNNNLRGYSVSSNGDGDIYYDDDAQVAFAFVAAYEVTQNKEYLDSARELIRYLIGGWNNDGNAKVKGGILWHRDKPYISAISNTEVALSCLRIAKFIPNEKDYFVNWAAKIIDWVIDNLLDKEDYLVTDGIDKNSTPGEPNRMKWTYNTGTTLNATALLYEYTHDEKWAKLSHDLVAAAVSRDRSLFCRDYIEQDRRYWRDPSYFIQLLLEGLADYLLIFGDKAPEDNVKKIKEETFRHLDFFRKYNYDPKDGLYFQTFEPYRISPDHHKLYCEQFGDQKGFDPNNEERSQEGDGPLENKPLVKTLIGSGAAARIWFQGARILPELHYG
ncbi:hypothetical protein WICMUC_004673 [Wickerhamomyces mucosus]|uniref:Mannan endo-1,6-alpha-mannosidase n=1 Tax=Wickerhamomyces mucosus TaxID=1378264 RepID=A0A9P8TAR6_9ASCO|nr:hypothetical protein WICMUC_004673 [Wickerhamomyces mucosus]